MKKLGYTLMLLVGLTSLSFAQEEMEIDPASVVVTQGAEKLEQSKNSGNYVFVFNGKTEGDISGAASYYAHYFKVEFDESSQTAKLEMIENDERARAVIMRFLVAAGTRNVSVDEKVISVNDFMSNHL